MRLESPRRWRARTTGWPRMPARPESSPATPRSVQENVPACVFTALPPPCAGRRASPSSRRAKDPQTITDASDTVWRRSFRETLVLGRLFFREKALQRDLPGGERRKAGGRPARAGQRAVCRARGDPGGLGGRDRLDLHATADDGFGEFEPAAGARGDDAGQAPTPPL